MSYVVRRTLTLYGAGNMDLDRAERTVGDREAADPAAKGAAAGRRNAGRHFKPQRLHADKAYDVPRLRKWLWGKHIGVRIARK